MTLSVMMLYAKASFAGLLMNMGQMMEAEFPGETEVPDENPAKN
jgi:hypothetical protein